MELANAFLDIIAPVLACLVHPVLELFHNVANVQVHLHVQPVIQGSSFPVVRHVPLAVLP